MRIVASKRVKNIYRGHERKIALVGVEGITGLYLLDEILKCGYHVTVINQESFPSTLEHRKLSIISGSIDDVYGMSSILKGHDVAISAIEPEYVNAEGFVEAICYFIIEAKKSDIRRLIVIGQPIMPWLAGEEKFYESWRPIADAQKEVLKVLSNETELEWTYIHTPYLEPDKQTGFYPVSNRIVITNSWGESEKEYTGDYINAIIDRIDLSVAIMEGNEIDI